MSRTVFVLTVAVALNASGVTAEPAGPFESSSTGDSARGSNRLNPAISLNGLLSASWRSTDTANDANPANPLAGQGTGISLQEVELIASASVDPYLRADVIVAFEDAAAEGHSISETREHEGGSWVFRSRSALCAVFERRGGDVQTQIDTTYEIY